MIDREDKNVYVESMLNMLNKCWSSLQIVVRFFNKACDTNVDIFKDEPLNRHAGFMRQFFKKCADRNKTKYAELGHVRIFT